MSTVLNDRDAILQAAAVRIVNPKNASILLTAVPAMFHLDAAGQAEAAEVTVTARLLGLEGDVTFTVDGASISSVTGSSAVVRLVDMQGSTAIVRATMMAGGEQFTGACLIGTLRDGASGGSASVIVLTPSQHVFKIGKDGANSPASITLTATGQNLNGTPSFTVPVGTATLSAGANSLQKILTFANMATDSVTVQVAQDGVSDRVTIVKLREGADGAPGADAIVGLLSNESVTLPASSAGVVSSYSGAACSMTVYKGAADDSANWAYAFSPASAAARVTYTASGRAVTITGMAADVDTAYVDITATKAGAASITKRFTVTKSRAGASITGARGAGHYYAAGATWSDGIADAATPGGNVAGDVVTISSGTYVMEKRWTGAEWVENGVVIDGRVIIPESILAGAIDTRGLTVKKPDGTLLIGVGGLTDAALPAGVKNSEIVVGGRNLFPDGDFERGIHTLSGGNYSAAYTTDRVGVIRGTKALFIDGTGTDMYVYLGTRVSVTPGKEYRISFYAASATGGVIPGSSSYLRMLNSSGALVDHSHLPMDNLGVGSWKRQVVAWTCPPGVTQIEPRFGIHTNGVYSWLAIDCVQIEEGNTVTQWTSALEDIAADAQLKANAAADVAYVGAIADANGKLATKLNKSGDVLGGIFSVDTVNAPAGFRAGTLTWNTAGDYTGGYGTAMTPKGLIGYNTSGQRTFMVNGQTGDIQIRGDMMGDSYTAADWPAAGGIGYFLGHVGLFLGNPSIGKYVRIGSDGNMYMPGFTHENGQLTLTNTVIVTPRLRTDFFITVPNLYLNSQVNTNSYQQFAVSATLNNGTGPYRYNWSFQMEEGDIAMGADPSNTNGIVRSRGTNRVCSGFLTCTVTDANGATHSDSGYIRIQFGSGVPV
jgi:hypothetical protein